jgi:hypothetical protein
MHLQKFNEHKATGITERKLKQKQMKIEAFGPYSQNDYLSFNGK